MAEKLKPESFQGVNLEVRTWCLAPRFGGHKDYNTKKYYWMKVLGLKELKNGETQATVKCPRCGEIHVSLYKGMKTRIVKAIRKGTKLI
jgi:hypothetical protein